MLQRPPLHRKRQPPRSPTRRTALPLAPRAGGTDRLAAKALPKNLGPWADVGRDLVVDLPALAGPFAGERDVLDAYLYAKAEPFFEWWADFTAKTVRREARQGAAELAAKEIRRIGGRYYVYTTTGRRLGSYPTLAGARRRLRQVEFFGRKDVPSMADNPEYWAAVRQQFNATLAGPMTEVVRQGATAAIDLGANVNWNLVNSGVQQLAGAFTHEGWQVLQATQQAALQKHLGEWVATGRPTSDLINRLMPEFGPKRAATWARTEGTRLFAEGQAVSYQVAGIRQVEWMTAEDSRVCSICGPLNGKIMASSAVSAGSGPPAHPNCRCDIAPVIDGKANTARAQYKELHREARVLINKAKEADAQVSGQLWAISNKAKGRVGSGSRLMGGDLPNGDMVGINFRIKGRDSLVRKMNTMFSQEGMALDEVAPNISDALRYTMVFDPEDYADEVVRAMRTLDGEGHDILKFKNYWDGVATKGEYKGINTVMRHPNGQIYELQFHTPQSFHTKEWVNHKLYEDMRILPFRDPRRLPIQQRMREAWTWMDSPIDTDLDLAKLRRLLSQPADDLAEGLVAAAPKPPLVAPGVLPEKVDEVLRGTGQMIGDQPRLINDWGGGGRFVPGTVNQGEALRSYKSTGYRNLNAYLRGDDVDDPFEFASWDAFATALDEALDEYRLAQPIRTYRGIGPSGARNLEGLQVGDVYADPAFVSTSIEPRFAGSWKRAYEMEIHAPEGTPMIWMESWVGKTATREGEFLMPRDVPMRVRSRSYILRDQPIGGPPREFDTLVEAVQDSVTFLKRESGHTLTRLGLTYEDIEAIMAGDISVITPYGREQLGITVKLVMEVIGP